MLEAKPVNLDVLRPRSSGSIGGVVWYVPVIRSTNDALLAMPGLGGGHGTVMIAGEQTAGRGRRGRTWDARVGSALLVSAVLTPIEVSEAYSIGALAILRTIEITLGIEPRIKWPNDVMIQGRKVCGILVDRTDESAVVGMGLNTNMCLDEVRRIGPQATSLVVEARQTVDPTALLEVLLDQLETLYENSRTSTGSIFQEWRGKLDTIGQEIEVQTATETWTGRAVDVAEDGSLLVTNDKRIVRVYAADVRVKVTDPV